MLVEHFNISPPNHKNAMQDDRSIYVQKRSFVGYVGYKYKVVTVMICAQHDIWQLDCEQDSICTDACCEPTTPCSPTVGMQVHQTGPMSAASCELFNVILPNFWHVQCTKQ